MILNPISTIRHTIYVKNLKIPCISEFNHLTIILTLLKLYHMHKV